MHIQAQQMSTGDNLAASVAAAVEKCCASCGITEIDDIKLKPCPKCDLVRYCSDKCQQEHLEKHEVECEKREAELYDELLFKQPECNHFGDCPICCLPMPHDNDKIKMLVCCGQIICDGCDHANQIREAKDDLKERRCPFCRHVLPETAADEEKLYAERAKLNDPIALNSLGFEYQRRRDFERAFHFYSKAAKLGDVVSNFNLSLMYRNGEGVEKDNDKERALLEKAAIAGHPDARNNLGVIEMANGRVGRAVRHLIIAAHLGVGSSLKALKECYKRGYVSKDNFAAALRAHHAAVCATKSPHRDAAEAYYNDNDLENLQE